MVYNLINSPQGLYKDKKRSRVNFFLLSLSFFLSAKDMGWNFEKLFFLLFYSIQNFAYICNIMKEYKIFYPYNKYTV